MPRRGRNPPRRQGSPLRRGRRSIGVLRALFVVLAVELLNTAVEKLADHVTREQLPAIRRIKDFGSAAVFCALCPAGLVWLTAIAVRLGLL